MKEGERVWMQLRLPREGQTERVATIKRIWPELHAAIVTTQDDVDHYTTTDKLRPLGAKT